MKIFQTLDDKSECVGIYADEKLLFDFDEFPEGLSHTWKYASYLRDKDIDYASLYLEGRSLKEFVPEYLQDDWQDAATRMAAFKRSLVISQVDTYENCFFDLVPPRFLIDFCEIRNKITKYVLQNIPRPERYPFYKKLTQMLEDMTQYTVNIDRRKVSSYQKHSKLSNQANQILSCNPRVQYNLFGSKTGRLTTKKGSFPILTLGKDFRDAIQPQHDYFVEMDFNGAEVRTLLGLLNKDQPASDVHQFHMEEVFDGNLTRAQAKVAFFAWLYGSRTAISASEREKLESFYSKDSLLEKYLDGTTLATPFKKEIKDVSQHHALNYLIQSTAADLCLLQFLKIDHLLRTRGTGSRVAFLIHDAVVLDIKKEDEHLIKSAVELMSSTKYGKFIVNAMKGKTLGQMKRI